MPPEDRLIEISRTLGRIEGSIDARFNHVNSRLDFQDQQRDLMVEQIKQLADAPRLKKEARHKAVMKWSGGALASLLVSGFIAVARGCVGR
jgi:hypothetical protein